jgi:Flp pilus assembly pilin Flp
MFAMLRTLLFVCSTHTLSTRFTLRRESGQTMAEYAVVLAVIAIGIFVALGLLADSISAALTQVSDQL